MREHGIAQFLEVFRRVRVRANDVLKWGDEIEYHLVRLQPASAAAERSSAVALCAPEVVRALEDEDRAEAAAQSSGAGPRYPIASAWRPEYGAWMVEAPPGVPYGGECAREARARRGGGGGGGGSQSGAAAGRTPFAMRCNLTLRPPLQATRPTFATWRSTWRCAGTALAPRARPA